MATFPTNPALAAVVDTTGVDVDFLNALIDNINAIGACLGDLVNNTADGNIDIAADKGIQWADTLTIYVSGGSLILDDDVSVTGNLAVTGTLSFTGAIAAPSNFDVAGTLSVDTIDDSGAAYITVNEDIVMAAGKYIKTPSLMVDIIEDSVTGKITINDTIYMGGYAGSIHLAAGGALYADHIADVGGTGITMQAFIDMNEHYIENVDFIRVSTYVNTPTLKVDTIEDSGAATITVNEDITMATGKYIYTDRLYFSSPNTYTITNRTTDRAMDCNTAADAELADVLGTLIYDLQQRGVLA